VAIVIVLLVIHNIIILIIIVFVGYLYIIMGFTQFHQPSQTKKPVMVGFSGLGLEAQFEHTILITESLGFYGISAEIFMAIFFGIFHGTYHEDFMRFIGFNQNGALINAYNRELTNRKRDIDVLQTLQ